MKSSPENEVQEEVTEETDEQENIPENGNIEPGEPEESVRNYAPSKFSVILSKKFLIINQVFC